MILAIDTSVGVSVALHDGERVVAQRHDDQHGVQGERCAADIAELLTGAGLTPVDITRVVVGVGPGPFTGLRVGIATAAAFALARGVPVVGVCSLDAVAHDMGGPCVVVSDARRGELYAALYPEPAEPWVATATDIAQRCPGARVVGPGAGLYPEPLPGEVRPLRAAALADLVAQGVARQRPLTPLYLRAPDATPPKVVVT